MKEKTIAFVGAGNMAAALIGGLINDGYPSNRLMASDPESARLEILANKYAIRTTTDNQQAIAQANVVILAVKPQVMAQVTQAIAQMVQTHNPLVISIAAGIRTGHLHQWLGQSIAIVRCMPNTPAMLQSGATGLFASENTSEEQKNLAESILRAVGVAVWVDKEELIDAVTAISGSGPAYFFLIMEQMIRAAISMGLDEDSARLLVLQTALGSSRMALESDDKPAILRARVTSPGGTTERAIKTFEEGGLEQLIKSALLAARDRSMELSSQITE